MKKIWFFVAILTIFGMFFATTQALAEPTAVADPNGKPGDPPGAQATQRAIDKAAQGASNSQGKGNLQGKRVNYQGTIDTVDASSLTITLADSSPVTFVINADTKIKIPTLGNSATTDNLLKGMKVNVHASQDGVVLTALMVQLVPGKPTLVHRVGTVTEYISGTSMSIQAQDGKI